MRFPRTVTALVLAATGALFVAQPATAAAPPVQFTKIQYDSPGPDTRTNASINGEWFRITNMTRRNINLAGWTVRDTARHTYTLRGYLLAKQSLIVRTGRGTDGSPAGQRYWGSRAYVWNNDRDTATLRDAAGGPVDTCAWTRPAASTMCG